MEDNKICINLAHMDQIKAFYGKRLEDLLTIIGDNREEFERSITCSNPDYCELESFFKNYFSENQ